MLNNFFHVFSIQATIYYIYVVFHVMWEDVVFHVMWEDGRQAFVPKIKIYE